MTTVARTPRVLLALAILWLAAPVAAQAQTDERCFTETGYCISGRLREFWEQNGGLTVFGLPITAQRQETLEGEPFQAQWFERARLELHPESQPPYDVLIGRLGDVLLLQEGRSWFDFPRSEPRAGCRFFAETGHNVCGAFLRAWQASGVELDGRAGTSFAESLALFGLPLSGEVTETIEGREYTVQWFERARLELHPQNRPPYDVLGGLLGVAVSGAEASEPQTALANTSWRLVSYGPLDAPVAAVAESPATVTFDSEGNVNGSAGCNLFGGSYQAAAGRITFGQVVSTLRICEGEALAAQERALLGALTGAARYAIEAGRLRIFSSDGAAALTLEPGAPQGAASVTGTVSYLDRSALPDGFTITVQLLDISRQDAPAAVVAEQVITPVTQVPIPYALSYDPARIDERGTYGVRARIEQGGRLLYASTEPFLVITQGRPTTADIIVERV
jgi:uncharacterized lipoprotein YbaY